MTHASQAGEPADPMAALKAAWIAMDAGRVEALLEQFPAARAMLHQPLPGSAFGSLAIHDAVNCGSIEMVDVLLRAGADINARTHWWAGGFGVLDGNRALAPLLIERGAIVDVHAAARLGMMERLRELLDEDPALVHARGGDGQTPLHMAATLDIAKLLVERGADIDARDIDHESTPAQYLVRDHPDIVRFLIASGCRTDILMAAAVGDVDRVRAHLDADPSSISTSVSDLYFPKRNPHAGGTIYQWTLGAHKTPYAVAREFGHEAVLTLLRQRSSDELKLAEACASGDSAMVDELLARSPDLAGRLSDGDRRRVADAARNDDARAVRLMLAAGWPVDVRGQERGTPLHWAGWHGNLEMVQEILRYRPPLDADDNAWKSTPLGWTIYASKHGWHPDRGNYPATVQALIDAGSVVPAVVRDFEGSDEVRVVLERNVRRAPI